MERLLVRRRSRHGQHVLLQFRSLLCLREHDHVLEPARAHLNGPSREHRLPESIQVPQDHVV